AVRQVEYDAGPPSTRAATRYEAAVMVPVGGGAFPRRSGPVNSPAHPSLRAAPRSGTGGWLQAIDDIRLITRSGRGDEATSGSPPEPPGPSQWGDPAREAR